MNIKKYVLPLCLLFAIFILSACTANSSAQNDVLFQSPNVTVMQVEEAATPNRVYYEWTPLTQESAYRKNTVILTGTAENVRPAVVKYRYMDTDVSDQITIFDVKIKNVLACHTDTFPDAPTITLGVGYNQNVYSEELPMITEGTDYLLFCYLTADQTDSPLELSAYVDGWISAPNALLCEKVGNAYLTNDFFEDVPGACSLAEANSGVQTNADAEEAVLTLNTRAASSVEALDALAKNYYLIDASTLEAFVSANANDTFAGKES